MLPVVRDEIRGHRSHTQLTQHCRDLSSMIGGVIGQVFGSAPPSRAGAPPPPLSVMPLPSPHPMSRMMSTAGPIVRHNVDVIAIGPLYKMLTGDPVKEEPARQLADTLDRLLRDRGPGVTRSQAHTPYAESSRAKRPNAPTAHPCGVAGPSSASISTPRTALAQGRLREERDRPARLQWSTPWPWAPTDQATESTWAAQPNAWPPSSPTSPTTNPAPNSRRTGFPNSSELADSATATAPYGTHSNASPLPLCSRRHGLNCSRLFRIPTQEGQLDDF